MGKIIDLTNKQFGYLTVLNKTNERGSDRSIIWECKCSCGKILKVNGSNLRSGHTTSCGCKRLKHLTKYQWQSKDLSNQSFGLLTAIEPTSERTKSGSVIWKCRCRCGNIKFTSEHCLTQNIVQSCGCLTSKGENKIVELLKNNNISFEQQKTFENCISSTTGNKYKFDFWVNNSYLIEFDGEQHFLYKENGWNTKEQFEKTQKNDKEKNDWCKKNNIPLIRIPYTHFDNLCIEDLKLETTIFLFRG